MTNIFQVSEEKQSLQRGTYKLDSNLYAGFKKAAENNQMYMAIEYLVQMMEIINDKLSQSAAPPAGLAPSRQPTTPPAPKRPAKTSKNVAFTPEEA